MTDLHSRSRWATELRRSKRRPMRMLAGSSCAKFTQIPSRGKLGLECTPLVVEMHKESPLESAHVHSEPLELDRLNLWLHATTPIEATSLRTRYAITRESARRNRGDAR